MARWFLLLLVAVFCWTTAAEYPKPVDGDVNKEVPTPPYHYVSPPPPSQHPPPSCDSCKHPPPPSPPCDKCKTLPAPAPAPAPSECDYDKMMPPKEDECHDKYNKNMPHKDECHDKYKYDDKYMCNEHHDRYKDEKPFECSCDCKCKCPMCPSPPPPPPKDKREEEKHECFKCKSCWDKMHGVDYSKMDAEIMNAILSVEHVLAKYYSKAADSLKDDDSIKSLAAEFGSQATSHVTLLNAVLQNYTTAKPEVNVSRAVFAKIAEAALGQQAKNLDFDAYKSADNILLAASLQAPLASSLAIGSLSELEGKAAKTLVAGVSAELAGQKSALELLLKQRATQMVAGLNNMTVAEFSNKLFELQKKFSPSFSLSKTTAASLVQANAFKELGFLAADKHE